jgi:ABC-type branched-subunit amino acid transport system substrate-binding protein
MGVVAVSAEKVIAAPPPVVFDRFGSGPDAGWLFDARCDRLATGAFVSLHAPLGGPEPVAILGRVSSLRRPGSITITHDQPWRGRIRLRFASTAGGTETRVRLVAEIDQRGLDWLMRRRGLPVREVPASGPRIGLLTSKSGSGSLFAAAAENVASLAVDEINAEGGVGGHPLELLVADDQTDPAIGAIEARRLVRAGCVAIFVLTTSATFDAVSAALTASECLVVQPQMNEGGDEHPLRIQLGERPTVQLAAAVPAMMRAANGKRWFLAGNDYTWPRQANAIAEVLLRAHGGRIVGKRYAALGTSDFAPIVDAVMSSGADVVLNTFVGADAAAFERQCYAMGLRDQALSLGPAMDESTLDCIGERAAQGIYGISGYFQRLETDGNNALLHRYREAFGQWAPSLSTLSESSFEAIHMWSVAARRARTTEPRRVADEMRCGSYQFPRGTVVLDGTDRVQQQLYLAETKGGTFAELFPIGDKE